MEKIKRFIECLVPVTVCNLECNYCYIIQENRRSDEFPKFEFSAEHIGRALSIERLGGICYISICGAGETLLPKEIIDIIRCLLEQGHYVNITTNGTISKRFDDIITLPKILLARLHFSFSFHYLQLLQTNQINQFFSNVNKIKKAGGSFLIQMNLCDQYLPHLQEIKAICEENVGAAPQMVATRNEQGKNITLMTQYSKEEYAQFGNVFESPLFDFTMKNFMIKRHEFCYAGDWSFILDLSSGVMRKCYETSYNQQNIFEDINKPIKFEAIGNNCRSPYCINSSHFMSLGVIPSISTPSYAELRNRADAQWYTPNMKAFLESKLYNNNDRYSKQHKLIINLKHYIAFFTRIINKAKKIILQLMKKS